MQRAANTSRFLIDFSSGWQSSDQESAVSHSGLLHNIVVSRLARTANSRQAFNNLAQRLIRFAEHAYSLRDLNALKDVSQILISLPIADAQQIGQYYQAIVIKRKGRTYEAQSLLEAVANNRPLVYRARAIQALGALYHDKGQLTEALSFHLEAVRAASDGAGCDLLAMLMAHLEISHVLSDLGDHQGALAILENLLPLIHSVTKRNPLYFYLYHNELAIEFAELGRIAEAEAACAIALASPFAPAYPEWSETRDEIAARRQSVSSLTVAVQKAEADASQQVESERNSAPSHTFALNWFVCGKTLFQRTEVQIAIPAVIAHCSKNQIILERFGETIKPRAPPVTYP